MPQPYSTDLQHRNQQILHMSRAGMTSREIARYFGITCTRVDQIVRRLKAEEELECKIGKLGAEMRCADDLDKEWLIADLLDALRLRTATRKALIVHFGTHEGGTISLRRLMDVASAEVTLPWSGELWPKLLTVRHIGGKGYRSIINGIGGLQLGQNCRREWEQRLERLRRGWRISGSGGHRT